MKYIDKEIEFNNVKGTGINLNTGLPIFSRKYEKDNDGNIISNKSIINAIDIDWNAAQLQDNEINTTGDLLNVIKDLQNKINILNEKVFNDTIEYNNPTEFCIESINSDVYISWGLYNASYDYIDYLEYSFDRIIWDYIGYCRPIYLERNKKLYIRGNNIKLHNKFHIYNNINDFYKGNESQNAKIEISGNIMSLLYKEDFNNKYTIPSTACFSSLFENCICLYKADKLLLPATTLAGDCYAGMFTNCTNLITAPELPAIQLEPGCYSGMFSGCTSLVNAPELPATTLAYSCYIWMFKDCTSLVNAPELPATQLTKYCYSGMFSGCTSLVNAPELPATQLSIGYYRDFYEDIYFPDCGCYSYMFKGCTSLINAPELPATQLEECCYFGMFLNCTSLVNAPELPATQLAKWCYGYMFKDCTSLVNAPELPATQLEEGCYNGMFIGCTSIINLSPEYNELFITGKNYNKNNESSNLALPKLKYGTSIFIEYNSKNDYSDTKVFSEYDLNKHMSRWIAYSFENNSKFPIQQLEDQSWQTDPNITQEIYTKEKYDTIYNSTSEFIRGHIGMLEWQNVIDGKETNYYSLCMPMYQNFNAGIWYNIENFINTLITKYQKIYVVMGGTIDSEMNIKTYINNSLPVPNYYYAAILIRIPNTYTYDKAYKSIAFWVQHKNNYNNDINLNNFIISIDELEQKTGIDFFCNLPDDFENICESIYNIDDFSIVNNE